jgi:hexosaminidase
MEVRAARLIAAGKKFEAEAYRLIDPADTTEYRSIQNYSDNTLNVCLPATYRFVDTVVDALAVMHKQAEAPLKTFHLGADETAGAWVKSPACKAMIAENGGDAGQLTPRFIERVSQSLAAKGLEVAGWSDGMGHTETAAMPKKVQTNIWGVLHAGAIREAHDQMNRGWDAVLSIPDLGYFDMPYAPNPEEGGYNWASRGVDPYQVFGFMPDNLPANAAKIRNIQAEGRAIEDKPALQPGRRAAGLQAQLWSETIRTDAQVDYMLFPRLLALAERAWSPAPWTPAYQVGASYEWGDKRVDPAKLKAGWQDFAGRVAAQWPMLEHMGIAYRVAPPGARIANGRLEANSMFPGTAIEYRLGTGGWTPYTGPVAVSGPVDLRSRSADGKRASRTVRVEPAS